ncbi:phage protein [Staphylococcus aureus]|uniref:Phage protein n=1 Tax=Staphylococcus aureus TaxID=1280 RepID=A0A380EL93_STAAU|nr:phage protein [Staphylococcus aureus]
MIKKLKNMDGFDIFIVGILSLFGKPHCYLLSHCLSIQWLVTKTKEVHQGTITDKYNKRQIKRTNSILY